MSSTIHSTDLEQLIEGLNQDLTHEYAAMIQYIYNASAVSGLSRQVLKPYFEAESQDELNHARYLSEKIINLGGIPEVKPTSVKRLTQVRDMLQHALNEEVATIERYKTRLNQADKIGDIALKIQLEEMIADETNHKEELERLLKDTRV